MGMIVAPFRFATGEETGSDGAPFRVGSHSEWGTSIPATIDLDYPSVDGGIQSDDVALIFVYQAPALGSGSAPSCAAADGQITSTDMGSARHASAFWKRLDGSESGTIAVSVATDGSGSSSWFAAMVIYRGCVQTGDPFETAGATNRSVVNGIGAFGVPIRSVDRDRTMVNFYTLTQEQDVTKGAEWTEVAQPNQTGANAARCLISEYTIGAPGYRGEQIAFAANVAGTGNCVAYIRIRLIPETPVSSTVAVYDDPNIANTVFLGRFDGPDAQKHFVNDIDPSVVSSIVGTTCETDTAQSKFGGGSLRVSSSGATFPDSADWHFGSSPFTVEAWVRFSAISTNLHYLIGQYDPGANQRGWALIYDQTNGNVRLNLSSAGTAATERAAGAWSPSAGAWYHVAADFDGTNYRTYVDGVMKGKEGTPVTLHDSTVPLSVGSALNSGAANGNFNGWLDEVRITKGVARYASDSGFTVPSAAYPRS